MLMKILSLVPGSECRVASRGPSTESRVPSTQSRVPSCEYRVANPEYRVAVPSPSPESRVPGELPTGCRFGI